MQVQYYVSHIGIYIYIYIGKFRIRGIHIRGIWGKNTYIREVWDKSYMYKGNMQKMIKDPRK